MKMTVGGERRRVDDFGRAYAGSQRQIQTYVNLRPLELSYKVLKVLSPPPAQNSTLRWVSPLAREKFVEYRDEEFLRVLGLERLASDLREFWPEGGPSWDALGVIETGSRPGCVLVEAKSHISELVSQCQATNPRSLKKIQKALEEAKGWLRVPRCVDWTERFYQSANRLAFLRFLRSRGIEAWLVAVYFLSDPHFKDPPPPHSPAEWEPAIDDMKQALGLSGRDVPYTGKVFLEASGGY
jgi:hypothetical protein